MKRSPFLMQALLLWLGLATSAWAADKTEVRTDKTARDQAGKQRPDKSAQQPPENTARQGTDKAAKQAPDKEVKQAPGKAGADRASRISVPLAPTPEELQRQRQLQKQAADARDDPNRQGRGRFPTQVRNTLGPGNSTGNNSNQSRKDALQDASGPSGARTPIP